MKKPAPRRRQKRRAPPRKRKNGGRRRKQSQKGGFFRLIFPAVTQLAKELAQEMDNKKRNQRGGASVSSLRRGPSVTDKIGSIASMFLSGPAPTFGTAGRLLGKQLFKGIKDNVDLYRSR